MNYKQSNYNNYNSYNKPNKVSWKENYDNQSDTTVDDNTNINVKNVVLDYLYNKLEVSEHKYFN